MSDLHPVDLPIMGIDIDSIPEVQGGYMIGRNDVTRIEACSKPGLHCDIPYIRVWAGDECRAEFCQHNIVGVYFTTPEDAQRRLDEAKGRT
ncbi:hypothetical protein [Parasphingorhabdus sp.]|uniref:hypothetical protein n=1 Tax=Parasphingorhabdus sp. TaxID=2709688 RepID=UPI003A8EFB7E